MPSVTYSSTRGGQKNLTFPEVVMTGLAHDRGLFVPDTIPTVTPAELEAWRSLPYDQLSYKVMSKFICPDQIPTASLQSIITTACKSFRHSDVTPVKDVNGHYVLELFWGPTFAFKDVALQMLGGFFEYFLKQGHNGGRLAVLGATSGDTGSAAIAGLRGKEGVDCVILYPEGRVSEIQERQMTTIMDSNIHCVSVKGTFDDCQDIVKKAFQDVPFREEVKLGAVNSINWARVLAQTTYYYWTWLRVTDGQENPSSVKVNFSVPTGNFGDILAGYYSRRMGLPVGELIVATNENDILHRFFSSGDYSRHKINETISPSMDICVSSNFERYLYHLFEDDPTKLAQMMSAFEATGQMKLAGTTLARAQEDFKSARCDTKGTLAVIKEYKEKYNYMLCPHSAVGVSALQQLDMVNMTSVALATAHEAKFPAACKRAVSNLPAPPPELQKLYAMKTRAQSCKNDLTAVEEFVKKRIDERMVKGKEIKTLGSWVLGGGIALGVVLVLGVAWARARKK